MATIGRFRLIVPAATAKPSPKMGQALGPLGINMMTFAKEYNERSSKVRPEVPCQVTICPKADRTYKFFVRTPQAQWFLQRVARIPKGSDWGAGRPPVGNVTFKEVYHIARAKSMDPQLAMGMLELPDPAQALKGRQEKMKVGPKHFVFGTPMEGPWPAGMKSLVFANGCFWGSEKGIWRLPGGGVFTSAVGYVNGFTPNPTYEEVCGGRTGATEAVQVVYDPAKIGLVDILRWFWEAHDPTCGMGQGNDRGTQYRSGLYFEGEEEGQLLEASKAAYEKALKAARKGRGPITTEVVALSDCLGPFYYGEDYHQQYLAKPGARPYCSAQPQEVSLPPYAEWAPTGWTAEQKAKYAPKLPEEFWKAHGPSPHCVIRSPNEPIKWP